MTHQEVGAICADPYCKKLDILPFICHYCKQFFCLEHFRPEEHQCPRGGRQDRKVFSCPQCLQTILLIPNELPDITWDRHKETSCHPEEYEKKREKAKCPVKECGTKLTPVVAYKCKKCCQTVCLKHRFEDTHSCKVAVDESKVFKNMSSTRGVWPQFLHSMQQFIRRFHHQQSHS